MAYKALIISQFYAPDIIGVAKYSSELANSLVERGWDVEVIAPAPFYPEWRVPPGYRAWGWQREQLQGATIWRVPAYIPAKPSGLRRVVHMATFALFGGIQAILRGLIFRPSLIMLVAPTIVAAPGVLAAAGLTGSLSWIHVQDFEVDAAFDMGLLKGAKARALALGFEGWALRAFSRVSSISPNMMALLLRKGVKPDRAFELRNWVNLSTIIPQSRGTRFRETLNIPKDSIVALYSGNMAAKQGIERLAEVAALLVDRQPNVVLVLCGGGPLKAELKRRCAGLPNVRFLDLQPIERLSELLATADMHLLPQRAEAADLVLPSKLTGMLASGRPVIAMTERGASLATEMENCGLAVEPTAEAMAEAIIVLARDEALRQDFGRQARHAAETRWDLSAIVDGFEHEVGRALAAKGQV